MNCSSCMTYEDEWSPFVQSQSLEHQILGQTPAMYIIITTAQWVQLKGSPDTSPLQYSHESSATNEL